MRIVLLGAPGSGKGTQAALLVEELGLPHISTGELLRSSVKDGSELGLKAKVVMDRGELVSDEIMLGLIEERLSREDVAGGFILDGYPRNIMQAEALNNLLDRLEQPVDEALQIDVDVDMVVARIAKRAAFYSIFLTLVTAVNISLSFLHIFRLFLDAKISSSSSSTITLCNFWSS